MWSSETRRTFPLSSVKPLEGMTPYRDYCLGATHESLKKPSLRRGESPVTGSRLETFGEIAGLEYLRCPDTGSLFLATLPGPDTWGDLLKEVNQYRQSPTTFHAEIAPSRRENVHLPKLDWIQSILVLEGLHRPSVVEASVPPSEFQPILRDSRIFSEVIALDETQLASAGQLSGQIDAAALLESLDRARDPAGLIEVVADYLRPGGLIFVTSLVSSGFDFALLGRQNLYLFPPDRTNCFSLTGLETLLARAGFELLEVSTPGVLDVEIVRAHVERDPSIPLSVFESQLLSREREVQGSFQTFLQQNNMSSFARLVGRKKR